MDDDGWLLVLPPLLVVGGVVVDGSLRYPTDHGSCTDGDADSLGDGRPFRRRSRWDPPKARVVSRKYTTVPIRSKTCVDIIMPHRLKKEISYHPLFRKECPVKNNRGTIVFLSNPYVGMMMGRGGAQVRHHLSSSENDFDGPHV